MTFVPTLTPLNGKADYHFPRRSAGIPRCRRLRQAYINLEDKDLVAVVDLRSNKVLDRWPVAPGGHPVGMAIDPVGHHLFIGCRKPEKMMVMSTETGKIESALPIGSGNDAARYDHGQAFASCRDGSLTVISERVGHFEVEQTVKTVEGARTMGIDSTRQEIFLPTAEMLPAAPGHRPEPKPGSFEIVVVSRQ